MDISIELNDYTNTDTFYNRIAARAIVFSDNKVLMIAGTNGDFKFPGGGMENGEGLLDTLKREVKEETGLNVVEASIMPYGKVVEKRTVGAEEKIVMTSNYFLCELEDQEIISEGRALWVPIKEAINGNSQIIDYENYPWVIREKMVLDYILNNKEKKLSFYEDFRCTADKCEFTCCREWKIEVDDTTYKKWQKLPEKPSTQTKKTEDRRVIKLNEKMNCPFLQKGLCSLVLNHGEQCISKTCQTFPRQINSFEDRKEFALVNCCPEVINLINGQSKINYDSVNNTGLFAIRDRVINILQNKKYTLEEGFIIAFYYLIAEDFDELEVYEVLEKLNINKIDSFEECNELFLDMSVNYINEGMYKEELVPWFDTAEELALQGIEPSDISNFNKQFFEFKELITKCIAAEMFANLYLNEYDKESVIVAFQWIAMEYIGIRQSCFLQWKKYGNLDYNDVKLCITIISRMTGYDEPDIREYMENSFDELIWNPGYLALIMGDTKEE